jgi:hypothetical protein
LNYKAHKIDGNGISRGGTCALSKKVSGRTIVICLNSLR